MINHVWQSTVFAVVAGLMTAGFRKNRAHVRYWLWLSASFKFLLPFSLLIGLGNRLEWAPAIPRVAANPAITLSMVQMSQPFGNTLAQAPPSTRGARDWAAIGILGVWVCGFVAIARIRFRGWRRIQAAVRASTPMNIPGSMPVRCSPDLLEPGVVGLFRPILLLPAGIVERLKPSQMEAVLAHELCHVRRRDNLTSAIHMIVEAVFWFHPLVWWIGARLVEERERACDEAVLSLGSEPHDYAEGILNVCKSYLESPLVCVAGVTGADLKKRIHAILTGRIARELTFAKKLTLALAGIAALGAPILLGIADASPKFEAVAIRSCEAFRRRPVPDSPGRLQPGCTTVERLIQQAYGVFANGHANRLLSVTVTGGPAWTRSDFYEIDAKAEGHPSHATMNGPMLQELLEDRFKLKIHRETREVQVFRLTVAKGGPPLERFQGSCVAWDFDNPPSHPAPPSERCGRARRTSNGTALEAATMTDLCYFLLVTLDRPVIDETGIRGRFNFHLELPAEAIENLIHRPHGSAALSDPAARASDSSLMSAIKSAVQKLGLNVEPAKGPGEFLAIDHVEKPSGI
ncbi:MAG TPA: M56 family metallopeptidase [Bryobacteraceae bacterium]|nr:M56 family metallopeptidase [Bryobacteraceae bacterium]